MDAWKHLDVPGGGRTMGLKGGMDTSRREQNPPEHRGGISLTLVHSGCMRPFMQTHEQLACACGKSAKLT